MTYIYPNILKSLSLLIERVNETKSDENVLLDSDQTIIQQNHKENVSTLYIIVIQISYKANCNFKFAF